MPLDVLTSTKMCLENFLGMVAPEAFLSANPRALDYSQYRAAGRNLLRGEGLNHRKRAPSCREINGLDPSCLLKGGNESGFQGCDTSCAGMFRS